jgi:O-methyltransferase
VAVSLYLQLLKRALTRIAFEDEGLIPGHGPGRQPQPLDPEIRGEGRDWPVHAETMIGMRRLEQLQEAVETVLRERVPGDLIETGVWRGGACILMRGVLAAYDDHERTVWVADSFQGIPKPDPERYPVDAGDVLWTETHIVVPLEQVQANFRRYGLLDGQVRFLPGWFRDTLPTAPIEQLAVLRLDGDLYESTIIALENLYPKLSPGGFVIVDDYALATCRAAVDDFRTRHMINEPLVEIDWTGVYWRASVGLAHDPVRAPRAALAWTIHEPAFCLASAP